MEMKAILLSLIAATLVKAQQDPLCSGFPANEEVRFPSPVYCNHYYKCMNGVFTEEICQNGSYFSIYNMACVDPQFAECLGGTGSVIPTTTTAAPTTTTPIAIDPLCEGYPVDEETRFPSPSYCNHYYRCMKGKFSEEICPTGLYFSQYNMACVRPEFAECLGGTGSATPGTTTTTFTTTTTTPTTTLTTTTSTPTTTTTTPTTTTTTPTTTTTTPTTTTTTPTTTTLTTTTTTPTTTTITTTTPTPGPDPRCIDSKTQYWPHPAECHWYIECWEGNSYTMVCPANKYFSDHVKKCVDAVDSECCVQRPCFANDV